MAYILIHTSSKQLPIQNQALRLQQELQLIGHHVEFSQQTHPFRLLKNNYDVFHVLSDKTYLSFNDAPLVLLAKFNRIATVVSQYDNFEITPTSIVQKIQSHSIDALSAIHIEGLKANKLVNKNKFILPLFPTEFKIQSTDKSKNISWLKVLNQSFDELQQASVPLFIDASHMVLNQSSSTLRKSWKKFQAKNPLYKNSILILNLENTIELMRTQSMIIDLSSVINAIGFQTITDLACAYEQFIVLNKNQASGYSEFWIHDKNCWISDLQSHTVSTQEKIQAAATLFFKKTNSILMKISIENKINELSRVYTKIMHEKTLTYSQDKARSA